MQRPNLYDYLKILALVSMIIDHIGYFLYPEQIRFRVFWRIAFPIFLLLVGYNGSYKWRWSLWTAWIVLQCAIWWLRFNWIWVDPVLNVLLVIAGTRLFLSYFTRYALPLQIGCFFWAIGLFPFTYLRVDYWTLALAYWLVWWWLHTYSWKRPILACSMLTISYYVYMIVYRWFSEETWWVLCVWALFLIWIGWCLSKGNMTYRLLPNLDCWVVWVSTHALLLYLIHWAILVTIKVLFDLNLL